MNNNQKKNPMNWTVFIIAAIIGFSVFPPVGIFLILYQFGIIGGSSTKNIVSNSDSARDARGEKYKAIVFGRSLESIQYLADAVGVPFDTAMRDLQYFVARGDFGADAYINYVDKTLVLTKQKTTVRSVKPTSSASRNSSGSAKKKSGAKDIKPYGSLPTWLLIIGIALLFIGAIGFGDVLDTVSALGAGSVSFSKVMAHLCSLIGGAISIGAHSILKKRTTRIASYLAAIFGSDYVSIEDLSKRSGVKRKTLLRDLEVMLEKHLLPEHAYIDRGNDLLVLDPAAAPNAKSEEDQPEDNEDRYRAILREIRQVNDEIPDPGISDRIDQMEELTASIFKAVQEKPEKLPQIKSFMSYYLPTALKLLHSYAAFDSSGVNGANVRAAKADIEGILDTLVDGFKKQLDKLYETEAMDISSDIDVLETMLRRDGLSDDGSGFGAVSGGKQ